MWVRLVTVVVRVQTESQQEPRPVVARGSAVEIKNRRLAIMIGVANLYLAAIIPGFVFLFHRTVKLFVECSVVYTASAIDSETSADVWFHFCCCFLVSKRLNETDSSMNGK